MRANTVWPPYVVYGQPVMSVRVAPCIAIGTTKVLNMARVSAVVAGAWYALEPHALQCDKCRHLGLVLNFYAV